MVAEIEEDENVDIGLTGEDNIDTENDEGRGFFEEPSFANDGPFNFPGDDRDDIPLLPEIENMENREPNVYGARPSYPSYPSRPHRPHNTPSYGHMDEYFKVDYYSKKYPTKRHAKPYYENSNHKYPTPSYGHSYHKGMNYMNPMDYNHNPKDVDVFRHKTSKYEIHEPFHHESQGFYDEPSLDHHLQHQDFFVDIPKINIASAIGNVKHHIFFHDNFRLSFFDCSKTYSI